MKQAFIINTVDAPSSYRVIVKEDGNRVADLRFVGDTQEEAMKATKHFLDSHKITDRYVVDARTVDVYEL